MMLLVYCYLFDVFSSYYPSFPLIRLTTWRSRVVLMVSLANRHPYPKDYHGSQSQLTLSTVDARTVGIYQCVVHDSDDNWVSAQSVVGMKTQRPISLGKLPAPSSKATAYPKNSAVYFFQYCGSVQKGKWIHGYRMRIIIVVNDWCRPRNNCRLLSNYENTSENDFNASKAKAGFHCELSRLLRSARSADVIIFASDFTVQLPFAVPGGRTDNGDRLVQVCSNHRL